jgi:hypothetical protein
MPTSEVQPGEVLPDEEHVVRYCRRGSWRRLRGEGFRVKARAFRSGRHPEAAISVNWLGYFGEDDQLALQRVCETTTYQGIDQSGKFVKLKSGDIRKIYIESLHTNLSAFYTPSHSNVSHAEIRPSGDAVFAALAAHSERYGSLLDVPPPGNS